jgi:peptidoglycan biosynthesis protein MviN/MurJ (putative lipid II flippase)
VAPDYVEPVSSLISWIAVAAFVLNFRANYIDHGFHLGNTTGRLTTVITVMAIVNLAGDLLLIPHYGALGAAQASIIAGVVAMIHGVIASRRSIVLPFPMAEIAKVVLATLAMGVFLWPFGDATAEIMAHHAKPGSIVLSVAMLLIEVVGGAAVFGSVAVGLNVLNLRVLILARLRARRAL